MKSDWITFLLEYIPFGGSLSVTLTLTLFIFISAFFLGKPLNYLIRQIIQRIAKRQIKYATVLKHIEQPAGLMSAAFIWLFLLNFMPPLWVSLGGIPVFLSKPIIGAMTILIKVIVGSGLVWAVYNLADWLIEHFVKRVSSIGSHSSWQTHFMPFITRFVRMGVVCFGGLLVLQSIGINVISLMAGLGLGGVALALAAKDSAANVLAYINIMMDKPFSTGDWIAFNNIEGTVMEVGLRSCKIKTFYDSIICVPNATLAAANIDNMERRQARRIRIYLGVQYDTPPDRMEKFVEGIKQVLKNSAHVKQDYFQVYFSEFAASELKIFINFFLTVSDWEMELQQRHVIFMEFIKLAAKLGVQFAFPTQTVHVESLPKNNQVNK